VAPAILVVLVTTLRVVAAVGASPELEQPPATVTPIAVSTAAAATTTPRSPPPNSTTPTVTPTGLGTAELRAA